jgi:hypothetical protein
MKQKILLGLLGSKAPFAARRVYDCLSPTAGPVGYQLARPGWPTTRPFRQHLAQPNQESAVADRHRPFHRVLEEADRTAL